jgi:predicted alpha/beta-fold hydrolase
MDYYIEGSCNQQVKDISIPVLFFFSLDDPIIGSNSPDYKAIESNQNCAYATTQYGAHLCTFQDFRETKQWMTDIGFNWLNANNTESFQKGKTNQIE